MEIAQVLASLASEGGMASFQKKVDLLKSLTKYWQEGKDVTISVRKKDANGTCHIPDRSISKTEGFIAENKEVPCIDQSLMEISEEITGAEVDCTGQNFEYSVSSAKLMLDNQDDYKDQLINKGNNVKSQCQNQDSPAKDKIPLEVKGAVGVKGSVHTDANSNLPLLSEHSMLDGRENVKKSFDKESKVEVSQIKMPPKMLKRGR